MNDTGLAAGRRGRPPKAVAEVRMPSPVAEETSNRPELRAPVREENSKERAAKRAAQLRGHSDVVDEGTDKFYISKDMIPDGWSYEWKRRLLLGQEDPSYAVNLARQGWEPVPVSRHPELMPVGWRGTTIELDGMILMERPSEIVDEARRMDLRRAKEQVRSKEAQLAGTPEGTMTRDHEKARPSIKKSYEAIPIPKD